MKTPFLYVVAFALCQFHAQPAQARLGEDEAALKKRFGEGKALAPSERPRGDHGLWKLFDSVLVFEKSGLVITAGMTDGKVDAIAYRVPEAKGKDAPEPIYMEWSDVATLLAFNVGESSWEKGNFQPITLKRLDLGAFADVEETSSGSGQYAGVLVVDSRLFDTIDDFAWGRMKTEYLKAHPSRNLSEF